MSNQRDAIIGSFFTLFEKINEVGGYNTSPSVYRAREDFNSINNFPALYLEETEPEEVIRLSFDQYQSTLHLTVTGAARSTAAESINTLIEDFRVSLDSTDNAYRDRTFLDSLRPALEPESNRWYFEAALRVVYFYNASSA